MIALYEDNTQAIGNNFVPSDFYEYDYCVVKEHKVGQKSSIALILTRDPCSLFIKLILLSSFRDISLIMGLLKYRRCFKI